MRRWVVVGLLFVISVSICLGDFCAYNDCIRGSGDTTGANATDWTIYNGYTSHTSGALIDYATGSTTEVTATFTWNSSAGLNTSETAGSDDGESQPRPGTDAHAVFGGIVDFSNRSIYYGEPGWWVEIEFTGLDPEKKYSFATTAIRGNDYTDRFTLFTISDHLSAANTSSEEIENQGDDYTVLQAGGNHKDTTGYIVRWEDIFVADSGDGTGSFTVRAEATGSNYRAYPFGGFMLEEINVGNQSPEVEAGQDATIHLPLEYYTVSGTVSDDGLGVPDGYLQSTWSQVSGPGSVEFVTDVHETDVKVYFPADGVYELQLEATDGELSDSDTVTVTVAEAVCPVGDIDGDCIVSLADLSALGLMWLDDSGASAADLNGDALVGMTELGLVGESWMDDWTGSVQVTILPTHAASAGGKWRVDDGPWHYSSDILTGLAPGMHLLEFGKLDGWARPEAQTVEVVREQTLAVSGQYSVPARTLSISEFMAVNSNVSDLRPVPSVNIFTTINGEIKYEDWVEIENLTDEDIDLEGWYLTDDPDDLDKWAFPAGTSIAARGYLVVYASNKGTAKYGYPFVDDLGKLHTNFELSIGGEYLALVQNGDWIEHEYDDYPKQRGLVSYGIDANGQAGYFVDVTMNDLNDAPIYDGVVADTAFSVDRGFYDAPFTVEITCGTGGAQIRYTTDGSAPTASHGTVYTGPVTINTTTCLRAAAFKAGYLSSDVDTQTYIFLDDVLGQATNPSTGAQVIPAGYPTTWPGGTHSGSVTGDYQVDPEIVNSAAYGASIKDDLQTIPTISLVGSINDLFGSSGIYINESQDGTERAGSAEFIDPNGMSIFQTNCGLRMQGGVGGGGTTLNRWKSFKLSFRLVFRGIYGGKLDYPLFGDEGTDSYDTVVLDSRPQNSWVHPDGTQRLHGEYVRDQAASNTQLTMGGVACHGRPVHVYVNGMYWGMYFMHERPDDSFAASYMGGDKDDYDVMKHDYGNIINGTNTDYIAMFNLSATSPDEVTAFENLKAKLDVPHFIDYLIANFYLGNGDWDHKNWYVSRNHFDPAGRWRWHMWDGEHVMDDGTSLTSDDVTGKNNSMAPTGLHQKWVANAEYRMLFADQVHKHFFNGGALTPGNFEAMFTALTDSIDRAVVGESARWGDNRRSTPYTRNNEWLAECNRLRAGFIPGRRDVVLAQFTGKNPQWYPTVDAAEFYVDGNRQYGGDAAKGSALTFDTGGRTVWYTLDGTDPRLPGGAESGTTYTGVITLDKAMHIKARAIDTWGRWSALTEAVFNTDAMVDDLRITEIMYNPADPNLEFVELKNIGASGINLNWVEFTEGLSHRFGDVPVAVGGFVVLVRNQSIFEATYTDLPAGTTVVQWDQGALDNDGDKLTLVDAMGRVIHSFKYKDGWYPLSDGDGFSLSIVDPAGDVLLWGEKESWRASTTVGGSPGEDEVGLATDSIVINELLAHSHDILPDWIELHNTTNAPISIGGWFLSDDDDDLTKYEIGDMDIPAGGYVTFYEDTDFGAAFALSENGETLYLTSGAGGVVTGYQVEQEFDASERSVSLGRYETSTGDVDFVAMSSQTPDDDNDDPLVGPIVITEIQYNPDSGNTGGEFIELRNISGARVYLEDVVETETAPGVFITETISWELTKGVDFTFPAGTYLDSGQFLIIAEDVDAFNGYYTALPAGTQVLGAFDGGLDNGGEKVRLCKPGEKLFAQNRAWIRVDQVTYDDDLLWPVEADGDGMSLQRIDDSSYGNDVDNWAAAVPEPGV